MNLPGTRTLRARITLLATVLVAAVSLLLLWLAWTLAPGEAAGTLPWPRSPTAKGLLRCSSTPNGRSA
ncbi:hypothetical protein ABT262_48415, partial [Amycolatopsis mediterranei]